MTNQLPIVQYWHSEEIPADVEGMLASFGEQNPDRPHLVFSESSAERFIEERCGEREASAFRACAVPAMQADYFRYCAGLSLGGICADADYYCARPCRFLIEEPDEGVVFQTPNRTVHNGFFMFKAPGHPLLRLALDVATANIENRAVDGVWWMTGPGIFTVLWEMSRLDSLEAVRKAAVERGVISEVEKAVSAIGEHTRVIDAFSGVRVRTFDEARSWLRKPDLPPLYKQSELHWVNWQKLGKPILR